MPQRRSPWASCRASRPTSPAARPPRSKADKNRHPPFGPASQGCLGARALLCRRGETARVRPGGRGAAGGAPRAGEAGRLRNRPGPAPVAPALFLSRESAPKLLFFPSLCPSCAGAAQRLPPPCRRVYSSPSRRTPVDAAARTPRTGYCGRRRRSDRPFRTGFIRWLEEGCEVFHKPPSFMNSLNPFHFSTLKSLFGRRVRSWLRTNAGGAPNTCKSRG